MRSVIAALAAMIFIAGIFPEPAWADRVRVAAATNFAQALDLLKTRFEEETGHQVIVTTGSTGKLYAQIRHGAPFDIFLSADEERPILLERGGYGVPQSRFTHAVGRLVLWSADKDLIGPDGAAILRSGQYRKLAIANPDLAPYGIAAIQTLTTLNLDKDLRGKIVTGENIGQTYALIATGNADLGFVALSSLYGQDVGSRWDVPAALHAPIRQSAILLKSRRSAEAFARFLKSADAKAIITSFGYGVE